MDSGCVYLGKYLTSPSSIFIICKMGVLLPASRWSSSLLGFQYLAPLSWKFVQLAKKKKVWIQCPQLCQDCTWLERKFAYLTRIALHKKLYQKLFVPQRKTSISWSAMQPNVAVWPIAGHWDMSRTGGCSFSIEYFKDRNMPFLSPLSPQTGMRGGGDPSGTMRIEATFHRSQKTREKPGS